MMKDTVTDSLKFYPVPRGVLRIFLLNFCSLNTVKLNVDITEERHQGPNFDTI